MSDVRSGLAAAAGDLRTTTLAGTDYLLPAEVAEPSEAEVDDALAAPLLLAPFDEYLLGYATRDPIITSEHLDRVVPGRNGMFKPVLVVDGEIVGVWSRKLRTDSVDVTVEPFTALTRSVVRALEEPVARYGAFLGRDARLELSGP